MLCSFFMTRIRIVVDVVDQLGRRWVIMIEDGSTADVYVYSALGSKHYYADRSFEADELHLLLYDDDGKRSVVGTVVVDLSKGEVEFEEEGERNMGKLEKLRDFFV